MKQNVNDVLKFRQGREEGKLEGLEQGREEGLEKGAHTKAVEIAKTGLQNHVPFETLTLLTGLSVGELTKLSELDE